MMKHLCLRQLNQVPPTPTSLSLLFVYVIKKSPAMLFWIAIAALWMTTSAEFLRDCHTTDAKPYIYYATKTPYELINNEDSSPIFVAGTY